MRARARIFLSVRACVLVSTMSFKSNLTRQTLFRPSRSVFSLELAEDQESCTENIDSSGRMGDGIPTVDEHGLDAMGPSSLHRLNHKVPEKVSSV